MDRRSFLAAGVSGTALAGGLAAPAIAQGRRTLTMVTSWGRGLAGVHDSAERCAQQITELTDGALTVDLKPAGELVGAFEVFDAVTAGQADIYHSADYYFLGQHPAFGFFATVPFGMTAQEMANWYYHGEGHALHNELSGIYGLKSFISGNTGAQAGGWFNREITGADDLQGLKFRMPGLGGLALGKLGVSVQNVPGSEAYQALSSGTIEATELIGPWADEKAGFQEVAKFYYAAGFHEPAAALTLAFNANVWNELTPLQQRLIETIAGEAHQWTLALFSSSHGPALQRLLAAGVQVRQFPDDVWDAFGRASAEVHADNMGDALYAKVHDSYMASLRASSAWIRRSDGFYVNQRDRVLG